MTGSNLRPVVRTGARAGFTFIELLIVMVVIGVLAAIAIPRFQAVTRKAHAAAILADYDVVRVAAAGMAADGIPPPGSEAWSQAPTALIPYLPDGFGFDYEEGLAEYRWRTWSDGDAGRPTVGLQIRAPGDGEIVTAIVNLLGGGGISSGSTVILRIE